MKVRLYITQEEIDKNYHSSFLCPIALAAIKILPSSLIHIQVDLYSLGTRNGKDIPLPDETTNFVVNYDCGQKVSPINFLVEI